MGFSELTGSLGIDHNVFLPPAHVWHTRIDLYFWFNLLLLVFFHWGGGRAEETYKQRTY